MYFLFLVNFQDQKLSFGRRESVKPSAYVKKHNFKVILIFHCVLKFIWSCANNPTFMSNNLGLVLQKSQEIIGPKGIF